MVAKSVFSASFARLLQGIVIAIALGVFGSIAHQFPDAQRTIGPLEMSLVHLIRTVLAGAAAIVLVMIFPALVTVLQYAVQNSFGSSASRAAAAPRAAGFATALAGTIETILLWIVVAKGVEFALTADGLRSLDWLTAAVTAAFGVVFLLMLWRVNATGGPLWQALAGSDSPTATPSAAAPSAPAPPAPPETATATNCPQCGSPHAADAAFCAECGHRFAES